MQDEISDAVTIAVVPAVADAELRRAMRKPPGSRVLVAAPGLQLNWGAIPGLEEALGKNGVTSNYRFDLAPYTWELVQKLGRGTALFTQPPMPIKCAGAPQKAMYLSCDHWRRAGHLGEIAIEFHIAGGVLFGVKEYVPALMRYVERYGIDVKFESRLIAEIPQGHRRDLPRSEFAPDSPLEGDGFELPVPERERTGFRASVCCLRRIGASERTSRFSPVL
jgi:NADPH-dependent 2,4-dienoyl-CoA reductase/sulfur reductase-like enzyme